ncbi:MAG: chemotaxis protein CheB [Desulfomonilaceae bacterium]
MATPKLPKTSRKNQLKKVSAELPNSQKGDKEDADFPIVGLGASAGGLEAFEQFFTNMPPNSGMAFVIVQHLDPTHKSILTELLGRYTKMKVIEVKDGMTVERNKVYVIPPNRYLAILGKKLHLLESGEIPGPRVPIDFFFRSLAKDLQQKAICIVLSGTGTEGALGLRAIKGDGGMAMVQDPDTAKYDGMPRHAIATGLADYVLSPDKMPGELIAFVQRAFILPSTMPTSVKESDLLGKLFILMRAQAGHDFSYYKRNTILRRVDKRMAVNQISRLADYIKYMQDNPRETNTLFKELLIGVTSFFRDKEAFKALQEKGIEPLCQNLPEDRTLRIWIPGCSTGEEAYSIAILCKEASKKVKKNIPFQIFATDIDVNAIEFARTGTYPASITVDVPNEYLENYFRREDGFFRINKEIRDSVVFALQNVIADPPFSRIDLISCRNLLIYLTTELQKKVLPLFHYALNDEGILFLGTAETVGEFHHHFQTLDRKGKVYRRIRGDLGFSPSIGTHFYPSAPSRKIEMENKETGRISPASSYRDLIESLIINQYSPVGVLANEKGDVVYVHGRTGKYLEPATGDASWNLIQMAREGLRLELASALRRATVEKRTIRIDRILVKSNGSDQLTNLVVVPVEEPAVMKGLMLVLFEEVDQQNSDSDSVTVGEDHASNSNVRIHSLEHELRSAKEYLQTTIEELETSNEELKSTNEELQSSNEELQSTNEELETSKEELQSVNEELTTVNTELQQKIDELSKTSSDLSNLLASTQIGTIFLDTNLHIQRYTPEVTKFVNLIQSDVGRPLAHLVSNLIYENVVDDAQEVLNDLVPKQIDVQTKEGRWYTMRILPYRTIENVIDGVVITFFEITDLKRAQHESEKALKKYDIVQKFNHQILGLVTNVLLEVDTDGRIKSINDFGETLLGYDGSKIAGSFLIGTLLPDEPQTRSQIQGIISEIVQSPNKTVRAEFEINRVDKSIMVLSFSFIGLLGEDDNITGFLGVGEPVRASNSPQ